MVVLRSLSQLLHSRRLEGGETALLKGDRVNPTLLNIKIRHSFNLLKTKSSYINQYFTIEIIKINLYILGMCMRMRLMRKYAD